MVALKDKKRVGLDLIICAVYTGLIAGILLLDLILADKVHFAVRQDFDFCNLCYMVFGVGFIILSIVLIRLFQKIFTAGKALRLASALIDNHKLVLCCSLLFVCVQVYLIYQYYFLTGWDVGSQIIPAVEIISQGMDINGNVQDYFSVYPNNLFLVYIFSMIRRVDLMVGVLDVEKGIMGLVAFQCAIFAVTAYLLYKVIFSLTEKAWMAWLGWLFYIVFIGLSPWFSIPYSDSTGLLFPILTLYFYLCYLKGEKSRFLFLIAAFGYLAYRIKPQAAFMTIAIIVSEGINWVRGYRAGNVKIRHILKKTVCILLALLIAFGICFIAINSMQIQLDKEAAFGWQHFLMMGLNAETKGVWNGDDVVYSRSFSTKQERNSQNISEAYHRIQEYGPIGMLKCLIKKALTTFGDGTFAWGREGTFFNELYEDRNKWLSPTLKSIYYKDGKYNHVWMSFNQICWMTCLLGMFGVVFRKVKKRVEIVLLRAMMIGVMGLTVFELLFEVRARYLFTFTPIFIILSVIGWSGMLHGITKAWAALRNGKRRCSVRNS